MKQRNHPKRIALAAVMLMAAFGLSAQPTMMMPTVASNGMRGPVKMAVTASIFTPEGCYYSIGLSRSLLFDTVGRLTDEVCMYDDGQHVTTTYRYRADGRLLCVHVHGGDATHDENFIYDNDGRLLRIEEWWFDVDSNVYHVTRHDNKGRPLTVADTANGGSP